MAYCIASKEDYHETMVSVYNLMSKGEANLTEQEAVAIREIAHAAEVYEDEVLGLKPELHLKTKPDMVLQKNTIKQDDANHAGDRAWIGQIEAE